MQINTLSIKQLNWIIVVLTFIIYWNSIDNEYAIDDNLVTENNLKVQHGLKAIPLIFTTQYAQNSKQNYGYRPIVLTTFAIEKQFFGKLPQSQTEFEKRKKNKLTQANVSHFFNVLLYAFTCWVLFYFLRLLFQSESILFPFFITLIFLVHPIHTEPVNNIKSRDELLMFLGIIGALIYYLKFSATNKLKYVVIAVFISILAILSKPSALSLIGIVPVVLYFHGTSWKKITLSFGSLLLLILFFGVLQRIFKQDTVRVMEFYENPLFLQGNFIDKLLMGFYVVWFYIQMLIFPVELSFYYGYNQLPIATWSHYQVWLGIFVFFVGGAFGFYQLYQRKTIGLGIVLCLGIMLGFSNMLSPIVGIVADRFAYLFSIGFVIVLAVLVSKVLKIDWNQNLKSKTFIIIIGLLLVYSSRTIARNSDWENALTLYFNDIQHLEKSTKAHSLISNTLYFEIEKNPKEYATPKNIEKVIYHYKKAIEIDTTRSKTMSNLCSFYVSYTKDAKSALYYGLKAIELGNEDFETLYNVATAYQRENQVENALNYYYKTVEKNMFFEKGILELGKYLIQLNKLEEGVQQLERIAQKEENPYTIYFAIANIYAQEGKNFDKTIQYFEKAYKLNPENIILCQHIAKMYKSVGNDEKYRLYFNKCNQ